LLKDIDNRLFEFIVSFFAEVYSFHLVQSFLELLWVVFLFHLNIINPSQIIYRPES
jgi:hypothetical protein